MIKKFLEFVNEGKNNKLNESQENYKIGKVNVNIDYDIASAMAGEENNDEIKKYLKDFISDFNLVSWLLSDVYIFAHLINSLAETI